MFSIPSGRIGNVSRGFGLRFFVLFFHLAVDLSLLTLCCAIWTFRVNRNMIGCGLGEREGDRDIDTHTEAK